MGQGWEIAKVKTVNAALSHLGKAPIADLGAQSLATSNAAVKILRVLDDARDTVLRRHGWECTLTYTALAPMGTPPANFRYQAGFQCPPDFLRVWEVPNPFAQVLNTSVVPPGDYYAFVDPAMLLYPEERWQLNVFETDVGSSNVIMTQDQLASLNLCYVRRAGWGALDVHVRDAIGYESAARACYSVTGDQARQAKLEQKAEEKILLAISTDATQEGGQPPLMSSIPALLRATSR